MNTIPNILIVDDDAGIRDLLGQFLQKHGFETLLAKDGDQMWSLFTKSSIDMIILDIMMPGKDGVTLCKEIRQKSQVPIIMLTAISEDIDRIIGLEMGADDYLSKPFNPRELLARVRAVLRRASKTPVAEDDSNKEVVFGRFCLDLSSHSLTCEATLIPLTSGEFDLLAILVSNPNKVLHRDRILDLLTGAERSPFDRSIDVRVTRLRSKLEDDPAKPAYIKTIWGRGYMFCPNPGLGSTDNSGAAVV